MICPYCGENDDKVIDSRASDGGQAIRRRRKCNKCGKRFTTYEYIERPTRLTVVKRDGSRVPFDREKILTGIEKACYKRPISAEQIAQIVDQAVDELLQQYEREVEAVEIGRIISEKLKRLDQIAYVRFASVYKQFRDLDDFLDEVRDVLETGGREQPGQGKLF